jgi:hypothetical protein
LVELLLELLEPLFIVDGAVVGNLSGEVRRNRQENNKSGVENDSLHVSTLDHGCPGKARTPVYSSTVSPGKVIRHFNSIEAKSVLEGCKNEYVLIFTPKEIQCQPKH